jgi:hypothetical protein
MVIDYVISEEERKANNFWRITSRIRKDVLTF